VNQYILALASAAACHVEETTGGYIVDTGIAFVRIDACDIVAYLNVQKALNTGTTEPEPITELDPFFYDRKLTRVKS